MSGRAMYAQQSHWRNTTAEQQNLQSNVNEGLQWVGNESNLGLNRGRHPQLGRQNHELYPRPNHPFYGYNPDESESHSRHPDKIYFGAHNSITPQNHPNFEHENSHHFSRHSQRIPAGAPFNPNHPIIHQKHQIVGMDENFGREFERGDRYENYPHGNFQTLRNCERRNELYDEGEQNESEFGDYPHGNQPNRNNPMPPRDESLGLEAEKRKLREMAQFLDRNLPKFSAPEPSTIPINNQIRNVENPQQIQPSYELQTNVNTILAMEKEPKNSKDVLLCGISQKEPPEFEKFFNKLTTRATKFPPPNPAQHTTAPRLFTELKIEGETTKTLIDTGAETSIVDPKFLFNLHKSKGIDLLDWGFNPNNGSSKIPFDVASFSGTKIPVIGVINVPIELPNIKTKIPCLIPKESINFNLVLGTSALDSLGFYLGNSISNEIILCAPSQTNQYIPTTLNTLRIIPPDKEQEQKEDKGQDKVFEPDSRDEPNPPKNTPETSQTRKLENPTKPKKNGTEISKPPTCGAEKILPPIPKLAQIRRRKVEYPIWQWRYLIGNNGVKLARMMRYINSKTSVATRRTSEGLIFLVHLMKSENCARS